MILLIALTIVSPFPLKAQVVKKIGGDSVVVLTIKQGVAINTLIDSLEKQLSKKDDSISVLNKTVVTYADSIRLIDKSFIFQKEELIMKNKINQDTLNDYKTRYYKNIAIYNQFEKDVKFEQKLHRFNSVLFTLLVIFLYSQIK